MPRPSIDLHQKVRAILSHVDPLPAEAGTPLAHYNRSSTDLWNLLLYVERAFDQAMLQPAARRRHMGRRHGMILVNLVESFERYLKEVAAVCVDHLARYVLDDRFNAFKVQGSALAAHFDTETLGRSLCASATWLDCDEVNDRFRRLLAPPFESGPFLLFPRQPLVERERYETLSIVWQLRHTIVHNVGVITQSDAIKLRLLARAPVPQLQVIAPTRDDNRYLTRARRRSAPGGVSKTSRICGLAAGILIGGFPGFSDDLSAYLHGRAGTCAILWPTEGSREATYRWVLQALESRP